MMTGYHVCQLARQEEARVLGEFMAFAKQQLPYEPFISELQQLMESYQKRERFQRSR